MKSLEAAISENGKEEKKNEDDVNVSTTAAVGVVKAGFAELYSSLDDVRDMSQEQIAALQLNEELQKTVQLYYQKVILSYLYN